MRSLLLLLTFLPFARQGTALGPDWVGSAVPEFRLQTVDGARWITSGTLKGSILVIDFWATWCPPCGRTLPALAALESRQPGVRVIAVNIDDDRSHALEFLQRHGLRLLAVYDEGKRLARQFDVPEMPSALVVDRFGIVRFVHTGYTESDIDAIVKEVTFLKGASHGS